MNKKYFFGLDTCRFIAAYSVLFVHGEQLKTYYNMPNFHSSIGYLGKLAVSFFFVLSGFLITFLLISEKARTDNISVKNFYIKRTLRIWPLYYLLVIIGLYIAPNIPFLDSIFQNKVVFESNFILISILLFSLLPNIAKSFYAVPGLNGHLWSIGVEEQFYLVWPWIVKFTQNKLVYFLTSLVVILPIIRNLPMLLGRLNLNNNLIYDQLINLSRYFKLATFDYMAFGGIIAIIYYKNYKFFYNFFENKLISYLIYLTLFLLLIVDYKAPLLGYDYFSYYFGVVILFIARNLNSNSFFELPLLKYLGKISYGIYMYHPIAIMSNIFLFKYYFHQSDELVFLILFQILNFILTITLAILSFEYIESPLLKLKHKITG